jgi:hypothetical protein
MPQPVNLHAIPDLAQTGVPAGYSTGLVPRNYATHPEGCYAFANPLPDDQLIPEADWPAAFAKYQADKSSLLDLREANYDTLKSLDQNGKGLSHTADTECLTPNGWVPWPEYNGSDPLASVNLHTGLMEFQLPTEHHAYEYNDEMYYSGNRRLDFGVTRNHRMLVRKWDEAKRTLSDEYIFQRADQLGWYVGMMHAPAGFIGTELVELGVEGDRLYDGDDFLALLAVIVSDGYAGGSESTKNLVSFCCFREDRYAQAAALAARTGFHEQANRRGVWSRNAPALANWLRANAYQPGQPLRAPNKRIPDLVKVASMRQIKHFLKFFGDQNHGIGAQCQLFSTSKRMIDDLQELHLRIGKRGTIGNVPSRNVRFALDGKEPYDSVTRESYTLTVGEVDRLCIDRKKHIGTDHYKGLVYCATVPNGTLITRRNGSVLISGNCWAFSSTKAVMYLRALMNEPGLVLSAWWVAGKVKGWRDQGGWGAESTGYIVQSGVPEMSFCPGYQSSYDTPATQANAALHKVTEWWDGAESRAKARLQLVSMLLQKRPCVVDLNWLSHSMCAIAIRSLSPLTVVFDNSWGEQGEKGLYVATGDKAIPDGLILPRVTLPSIV